MTTVIKIGMTVGAIAVWLFTQRLLGSRKIKNPDQIGDYLHLWTEKYNRCLNQSPQLAKWLLISSSLVIDLLGVFIIIQTFVGASVRPLLALIALFTLRQINQAITILPTPKGMIWHNPGVPSIFVTYHVSNDLFFSGHTALAVLGALELAQLGGGYFIMLAIAAVIFEMVAVILLRAHWTLDVFTGAVTALWVHDMMSRLAPTIDLWISNF